MTLILHDYWRSGAGYRTRIALNLKGVDYQRIAINLLAGQQRGSEYRALNPQGMVPALLVDGRMLTQSMAIIEWLEESYPSPALLPASPVERAIVRGMAGLIASDVHPLNNLRVLNRLRGRFGAEKPQILEWTGQWIGEGFTALEALVARHGGTHAFGDAPGLVDCLLVPQLYSAARFSVDLAPFPRLVACGAAATALPAFAAAHPERQSDAVTD